MLKTVLLALATIYALVAFGMYLGQRRLLYFPDATQTAPADVGFASVAEVIMTTPDGARLVAWHGKADPGQPTLLYFHGNGGSLANRADRIAAYLAKKRGVFILSYRGYSGSSGQPSEHNNVADARRAYDALRASGVAASDIIVYGESLGTGVAVQLLANLETDRGTELSRPVAGGLVLDSPFTSIVARAAELYPWLPVRLVMSDRYESDAAIGRVGVPIFIVHGEADQVVPVAMGRQLFALANDPKEIVTLPGAGHNDHHRFGAFEAVNGWIDRLRSGQIVAPQK